MNEAVPLYADETVSDLLHGGLRLIQPAQGFRFGEDTVLLADHAAGEFAGQPGRRLCVADLGAGAGASTLLLAGRLPAATVLAVELDPHGFSALQRNVRLNRLTDRIVPLNADYSRWTPGSPPALPSGSPGAGCYDMVVVNPPYSLPATRLNHRQLQARAESTMTLATLIAAARCLLRPRGRLVLIHRSQRLTDVLTACRCGGVEPKRLRLVSSLPDRPPARFLMTAIRDGRPGALAVAVPLQIRDSRHERSDEVRRIYNNDPPLDPARMAAGLNRLESFWPGREGEAHDEAF